MKKIRLFAFAFASFLALSQTAFSHPAQVEAPGKGPADASRVASVADVPLLSLNNGVETPQFGLGTFMPSLQRDRQLLNDTACEAVATALKNGYRRIDCAHAYQNEEGVGKGIKESGVPREEIWITSKLWGNEYVDSYEAVNQMLKRFDVEYLDLVYLHQPFGDLQTIVDGWKGLEKAYREGKIRALGISNFENRMEAFDEIMKQEIKPQFMQFECHPLAQRKDTRELAAKNGIQVECWYPLGSGNPQLLQSEVLKEIAQAHNKSVVQVIIRWHVQEGLCVIPGATRADYIKENINVFDFELSDDEMAKIRAMDKGDDGRFFRMFMGRR